LPQRKVESLAGSADVQTGEGIDKDCAAMWQGQTRYKRAQIFKTFMDRFFPTNQVSLTSVTGVGNDGHAMYVSPEGINAVFFAD